MHVDIPVDRTRRISRGQRPLYAHHPSLRLALTVGFLGAYTTFSTFSYEWLRLLQEGAVWPCLVYILGSVLGGGVAGVAGFSLGRLL